MQAMRGDVGNDPRPSQQGHRAPGAGQQPADEATDAAGACDHELRCITHAGNLRGLIETAIGRMIAIVQEKSTTP